MTRRILSMLALVALTLSFGVGGASHATSSEEYTGGTGDVIILECDTGGNIGGACFELDGDEASAQIVVDDITTLPVGAYYAWRDGANTDLATGSFCGSSAVLPAPGGAVTLLVFIDEGFGPLDCFGESLGAGVSGTINVTWDY